MANKTKLTPDVLTQVKELAISGYNEKQISQKTGFARGTIKRWCKDNQINLVKRTRLHNIGKEDIFIKILKETGSPQKAAESAGLKSNGSYIIERLSLQGLVRTRSMAAIEDKTLPLEIAQSRLPDQTHKVIGFEDSKYKIESPDGYVYKKTSAKLYQGDPRGKSGTPLTTEEVERQLLSLNYKLIPETYSIKRMALSAICLKCNNTRTNRLSNFKDQQCSICSNIGTSLTEVEVLNWIKTYKPEATKYRFKGITKGKEIDIYIPSLNLGIEYCGLYWHTEKNGKYKKYHYEKMKQANEQGIRLITVYEDEWKDRQSQVKNFLKSVLGICELKIFARKCDIKEIDRKIAQVFLNENHIQGSTTMRVAFGLYYNDNLVGLITGNKHHRQGFDNIFVLNRLVFKDGVQIIGGSSRLIKHLCEWARNNGYIELISWSDNRWSEGNVYEKTGFSLVEELGPDYSYVTPEGTRQSKQSNKKKNLLKKNGVGNTELEMATSIGYSRIWDCGKKRWSIIL